MKRLKSWRSVVLVILLVGLIFGGWYFTSQAIRGTYPQAWASWQDKIQDAVTEYRTANNGSLPIVSSGAVIVDDEQQYIIDMCRLKEAKLVPYPPENCISLPGTDDDNCDGGDIGNCSCHEKANYVWTVDPEGLVHSICIGTQCEKANADGYQNVWP
jgi:hypothetical protein